MQKRYGLRKKQAKSIFQKHQNLEEDCDIGEDSDADIKCGHKLRKRIKKTKDGKQDFEYDMDDSDNNSSIFDSKQVMDKLPDNQSQLLALLATVKSKTKSFKQQFLKEHQQILVKKSYVGEDSIPICADVTNFNFDFLLKKQLEISNGCYFDVIMMDPPWRLSTSQPSRGVAIQYDSLGDQFIEKIPVPKLQKDGGMLFIWAINAKYAFTIKLMEMWGYKLVDSITWVKKTVNGKIAKGHGFYLQHAKETCLIGIKGSAEKFEHGVARDVIFSDRRGQSQKPHEVYDYIEQIKPNGYYLEIFGRRNNLMDKWVTIGNQI